MQKRKEYSIDKYMIARTNKDRMCVCCGETVPSGSNRMMPKGEKSSYCLCLTCFREWIKTGGNLFDIDRSKGLNKTYVILMSKISKAKTDLLMGRMLYVAMKKGIDENRHIVIKFDADSFISLSTRVMNPSFGYLMDEYGRDVFKGRLTLIDVSKFNKDLITKYINNYKNERI